jgi:hypothetical protein
MKRYNIHFDPDDIPLQESENGLWVPYPDVIPLEARVKAAEEERDNLRLRIQAVDEEREEMKAAKSKQVAAFEGLESRIRELETRLHTYSNLKEQNEQLMCDIIQIKDKNERTCKELDSKP